MQPCSSRRILSTSAEGLAGVGATVGPPIILGDTVGPPMILGATVGPPMILGATVGAPITGATVGPPTTGATDGLALGKTAGIKSSYSWSDIIREMIEMK